MGKTITISVDVVERGRNGGNARAAKLSAAQRKASARKAAQSRWAGHIRVKRRKNGKRGKGKAA